MPSAPLGCGQPTGAQVWRLVGWHPIRPEHQPVFDDNDALYASHEPARYGDRPLALHLAFQLDSTLIDRDFHGLRIEMEGPDWNVVAHLPPDRLVAANEGLTKSLRLTMPTTRPVRSTTAGR